MRLTLYEAPTRETRPDPNTGKSVPYSLREVRGFFNVPCQPVQKRCRRPGDLSYDLSSLSEKTRTSNHFQMSLQRQHILLSYFKTPSVGPVWGSNPRPPARQSGALPIELTRRRWSCRFASYQMNAPVFRRLGIREIWCTFLRHLSLSQCCCSYLEALLCFTKQILVCTFRNKIRRQRKNYLCTAQVKWIRSLSWREGRLFHCYSRSLPKAQLGVEAKANVTMETLKPSCIEIVKIKT